LSILSVKRVGVQHRKGMSTGLATWRIGRTKKMSDTGITMIAMHNALRPAFDEWLASRGLLLAQIPGDEDECHIVVATDEKFAQVARQKERQPEDV
jgi:hypothetical protein